MRPVRVRINRIIDFGIIVSLVGIDLETGKPVTIHVDHQPSAAFWEAWREADFPQPIEYAAQRLLLSLNMMPVNDGGEVLLIEQDGAANDDHQPTLEIEQ